MAAKYLLLLTAAVASLSGSFQPSLNESSTITSFVVPTRESTPALEVSFASWVLADALYASSAPLEGKAVADAFKASSAPFKGRVWPDALESSAELVADIVAVEYLSPNLYVFPMYFQNQLLMLANRCPFVPYNSPAEYPSLNARIHAAFLNHIRSVA